MFALVTRQPRLRANRRRYNLTQSRPSFVLRARARNPPFRARRFTSSLLLKNGRTCSASDPKIRAKPFSLSSALCLTYLATGGADRDRTDDPLLAKQVLSQLSYSPPRLKATLLAQWPAPRKVVGLDGFEPSTPALSRRCSNQLSYRPDSGQHLTNNR